MTLPRSRMMAGLTVLAMLGIGIAIGIAVDRTMLHRGFGRGGSWGSNGGGRSGRGDMGSLGMIGNSAPDSAARQRYRARMIGRMREDLSLTPVQERAIDSIFVSREGQLEALRQRVRPPLDSLRDQLRVSIDAVLTPEQRTKFAEQRKRMDERRRDGGGPKRD
jgi:Spy/CpxP family protein refolding chaperone